MHITFLDSPSCSTYGRLNQELFRFIPPAPFSFCSKAFAFNNFLFHLMLRFLWRENATFAISRHYRRFDVFEEAEANKAAGKYNNESIDYQINFYKREGLTRYSEAKLPITSGRSLSCFLFFSLFVSQNLPFPYPTSADVPEGCVIIREHIPITNLFTCLWFNEVDRFTSRDQLSFSIVRDRVMAKTNWTVNMFLDCERRNFVLQVIFFYPKMEISSFLCVLAFFPFL